MAARRTISVLIALCALLGAPSCSSDSSDGSPSRPAAPPTRPTRDRFRVEDVGEGRFQVADRDGDPVAFSAADPSGSAGGWPDDIEVLNLPSPAMAPTMPADARVLVDRTPGIEAVVERGDVVVAEVERPFSGELFEVAMRVGAVGGDLVEILDGALVLDGTVQDEPYTGGTATRTCSPDADPEGFTTGGLLMPDRQVLLLGDNRENAADGRCSGPIDRTAIRGRVLHVLSPAAASGPA